MSADQHACDALRPCYYCGTATLDETGLASECAETAPLEAKEAVCIACCVERFKTFDCDSCLQIAEDIDTSHRTIAENTCIHTGCTRPALYGSLTSGRRCITHEAARPTKIPLAIPHIAVDAHSTPHASSDHTSTRSLEASPFGDAA